MRVDYPWLLDPWYENENEKYSKREFLKSIDNILNQRQYVKITLLNWKEKPIKNIEGEIASGTLTKDGSSAIRRSCNISCNVSREEYDVDSMKMDYSINKKIFLEIGIKNETEKYQEYPILWFPQGIFFISSFSISSSATSTIGISIGLKDKMAMLDGSIGGRIISTIELDKVDTITAAGTVATKKVKIHDIITELVNHIGGEDLNNIVVSDIPDKIGRIIRWTGTDKNLYISKIFDNNILNNPDAESYTISLTEPSEGNYRTCCYGDDIGYIYEDFVYDGELVAAPNSTITSALDAIKNYLGNFEYFYDEFGIFHFQEIKNYLNNSQSSYIIEDVNTNNYTINNIKMIDEYGYLMDILSSGKDVYSFDDDRNLISLSVNPQYDNIKNDFVVLGTRKSTDGKLTNEVMYHLVIDKKPDINLEGYSNILVYRDSETNLERLCKPKIVEELPEYGDINIIYGLVNAEDEAIFNIPYTSAQLQDENLKKYSLIADREEFNLSDKNTLIDEEISQKKEFTNKLVYLTQVLIDAQIDSNREYVKETDEKLTIVQKIEEYIEDIKNDNFYIKYIVGTNRIVLDAITDTIYNQNKIMKNYILKDIRGLSSTDKSFLTNLSEKINNKCKRNISETSTDINKEIEKLEKEKKEIEEKLKDENLSSDERNLLIAKKEAINKNISFKTDIENEIKMLELQSGNIALIKENVKILEDDLSKQENIDSLNEQLVLIKNQIAWLKSRENLEIKINNNSFDENEVPTYEEKLDILKTSFWYWDNVWLPIDWIRYYSEDNELYMSREYSYESLFVKDGITRQIPSYTNNASTAQEKTKYGSAYIAKDWRTEIILQGLQGEWLAIDKNNHYYEELYARWPIIYNLDTQMFRGEEVDKGRQFKSLCEGDYYFDFIDDSSLIYGDFSVSNIGRREFVTVSNEINCLFEPDIWPIGYILETQILENAPNKEKFNEDLKNAKDTLQQEGLEPITVPIEDKDIYLNFSTGGIYNGAFPRIKYDLLTHTNYQKSINLTAIPAWYLEPNILISIKDKSTNTFGNYMVRSISYNLGPGNTMSVSCVETLQKI